MNDVRGLIGKKVLCTTVVFILLLSCTIVLVPDNGHVRGASTGFEFPAGSTIIPMGQEQSQIRNAYKYVFWSVFNNGELEWTATSTDYGGQQYSEGTFISSKTLSGGFSYVVTIESAFVQKAYSLHPRKVAVLYSDVKDGRGQVVTWEQVYFESIFKTYLWGNYYTPVDESQIRNGALDNYGILIVPTIAKGYADDVVAELGQKGLGNIKNFVQDGGTFYAQGDSAYLAEAANLVAPGTVLPNKRVLAVENSAEMMITQPTSPITYSLHSDDIYVLDDPLFNYDDGKDVVATYASNLIDDSYLGSPAIISAQSGHGKVILVAGHPSENSEQFPIVFNSLLYGMSERCDVRNRIFQTYNPDLPYYLIPAYEGNVSMQVEGTFSNYWDEDIAQVKVADLVRDGFWVDEATITPAPVSVATLPSGTMINWTFDASQGTVSYSYTVNTNPEGVTNGWTVVSGTWSSEYIDPVENRVVSLKRDGLQVKSAMPANLLGDRDVELDGVYPLPAEGAYFDMAFPLENKEETDALEVQIIDIVPLKSPIVDVVDQTRIPDALYNTNFGTNNPVFANLEIFFYDNPNYPLPDGVTDYGTTFTVADADTTYVYNGTGTPIVLPAKKLVWTYGTLRAYDHKEPIIRYGLFVQEEYGRTVSFQTDPVTGSVILNASGGSVYTSLGSHCVPYHEYLQFAIVYMPEYPEPPRVDYKDIWLRDHVLDLRTTFFDIVPFPPPEEHAVATKTFEVLVDGQRYLEYPIDSTAELHFMIKSWNGYPPYDPVNYPYHMDMIRNETLIREAIPKGLGYSIVYDRSEFSTNTEIADIVDTNTHTILYYRQDLPASEKEVIDVYSDLYHIDRDEGGYKINDNARFVYRQIAVGPSRYEVLDNHVQVVMGIRNNVDLSNVVAPVAVGTYSDVVYQLLKVQEPNEPQELQDPYIKSHGFGNISATTYVGGRIAKTLYYSKLEPGDTTLVRIEISNNLGYDLTNVSLVPDAPAGITVTPASFNIPPIWYDFPFLDVTDIWDAWKGVYYFWVETQATGNGAVRPGEIYQIDFTLEGDNVPSDFVIPPALIGIKDAEGHVYMIYGRATDLALEQAVPLYVDVTEARIANEMEKADFELKLSTSDDITIEEAFQALRPISHSKITGGDRVTIDYELPTYAETMPWYDNGEESFTYYVISKSVTSIQRSGSALVSYRPKLTYTDHFGRTKVDYGQYRWVSAHGPAIVAQPILKDIHVGNLARDFLTAGVGNTIAAEILVPNVGDDIAQDPIIKAIIPQNVGLMSSDPQPTTLNPATGEVVWELYDIAPYSGARISLSLYTVPPMPMQPIEMFTILETVDAEFMHLALQQMVASERVGPPALNAQNILDVEAPGAPILNPIVSPTNQNAIIVAGTAEPDATVEILENGISAGTGIADGEGRFAIPINLVEGENAIAARATDNINNGPGPLSASQTVILDTMPPLAPILDPLASIISWPLQTVTGTVESSAHVEIFVNDAIAGNAVADGNGAFSTAIILTEGINVITARATDELGNGPGAYSKPLVVTLDNMSPAAPLLNQLPASTNIENVEVIGVSEPNALVRVFVNEFFSGSVQADDGGAFKMVIGLSEGNNVITAMAIDSLGNGPGASSNPVVVTLDTTPPEAPELDRLSVLTSNDGVEVTGTSEPGALVEIYVNDELSGIVFADENGAFNIEVTLVEGINVITARATDTLGNGPGAFSRPPLVTLRPAPTDSAKEVVYQVPWYVLVLISVLLIALVAVIVYYRRKYLGDK